jgi:hypothetical protein
MPMPNTDAEVAYTKPGSHYPAFINVQRKDDTVTVTLRGDARGDACGNIVSVQFTFEEWRGFFQNLYARL